MISQLRMKLDLSDGPLRSILLCACTCMSAPASVSAQEISAAEKLLLQTNHMQTVDAPAVLTYSYRKTGAAEPGFDDEVRVVVSKINPDKSAAVSVSFLSGDRSVQLAELSDARGNPTLLGFLERDIAEMKRLTGGSPGYFRKRIRLALAEAQELRPVRFTYAGKERQGQEVRIQPYLNDPLRDRFPAYKHKSYAFVVSGQVPGGLYRLRSASNEEADKGDSEAKPVGIVETLTLVKHQRLRRR
jgi:hypothetical protein